MLSRNYSFRSLESGYIQTPHCKETPLVIQASWDPIIAQFGSFTLGWHGIFTAIAVLVAVTFGVNLLTRQGVSSHHMDTIVISLLVGGVIGARLFHVFDHWSFYSANPLKIFAVWEGGIAVYGAFIGGIIAGGIAAKRAGVPVWTGLDVAAPAMLIGQAIGRLGCLSNGDAWGAPTGTDFGIVYSNPNDLVPQSAFRVPTHPYPVYEIIAELVLLGVLWLIWGRVERPGLKFAIAALGYAIIRFFLTYFRQENIVWAGLQEAQVVAILTGIIAVVVFMFRMRGSSRTNTSTRPAAQTEAN